MVQLILREAAEAEIEEAFGWYDQQSPGLGAEFIEVLDTALAAIQRTPEAFPLRSVGSGRALFWKT